VSKQNWLTKFVHTSSRATSTSYEYTDYEYKYEYEYPKFVLELYFSTRTSTEYYISGIWLYWTRYDTMCFSVWLFLCELCCSVWYIMIGVVLISRSPCDWVDGFLHRKHGMLFTRTKCTWASSWSRFLLDVCRTQRVIRRWQPRKLFVFISLLLLHWVTW